jgi:hypothetical protein
MTEPSMFKKDPGYSQALATLSSGKRVAFIAAGIGAIFPVLFLVANRPVYWLAAFQFACLAVLAYIRWRAPAFRGSLIVFILAVIACIVSIMAGFAA